MPTPNFADQPSVLDNISIASPCSANWDEMQGTDRVRYCKHCQLNVYNLSMMSQGEAENLLNRSSGRLCVRFYRRADGTVLTQDCPVGLRALRQRLYRRVALTMATVASLATGIWAGRSYWKSPSPEVMNPTPATDVGSLLPDPVLQTPSVEPPLTGDVAPSALSHSGHAAMGGIACPPNAPAQKWIVGKR